MHRFQWLGVVACLPLFTPLLVPQIQENEAPNPILKAHQAWETETGNKWILRTNERTGAGELLYGSKLEMPFVPQNDADFFDLGREVLAQAHGMFRVDDSTLQEERVKHLHLERVGTTNKVSVEFKQFVNGIPVHGGTANVLFTENGDMLSVASTALADLENFVTAPATSSFAAIAQAHRGFIELEGREAQTISEPELVIYAEALGRASTPRLAWTMEIRNEDLGANSLPSGRRMFVAADGSGNVLGNEQLIHTAVPQDLTGQVVSWATPGVLPDTNGNPEVQMPMRYMQVTSPVGNATTDANGNFTIPNAGPNPVDVTVTYFGTWVDVDNDAGADYSYTATLTPGVPGTVEMNQARGEFTTAQANGYEQVVRFWEWIKEVDPTDTTMDFRVLNNVNLDASCNAFFNGFSINHYRAAGCVNTAYSTVVAHEEGHWANVRYGSGNGSDGFGEGGADVWSMYIHDTAIVGENFSGPGGHIRTGNNTRQWCGSGCYGQVHTDGEVMMGALWKVRRNLNNTYGNTAGDDIANAYMLGWFNSYNQTTINPIIEEQWLTLDDNNGNIFDGTPNFDDIDSAFREQGFPGIDLILIDIQHAPLPNTQNENGPYTVTADISSAIGANVTGAEVKYTVNDGPEMSMPMNNLGGATYSADIPGQASVAYVDYYIEASDDQGNTQRNPRGNDEYSFIVGVFKQLYFNDFEGATDEGWTHDLIATQDDWQRGAPQGKVQDPGSAYSGTNVWANDLGNPGWNGEYASNTHNYLESPIWDFTGEAGIRMRFRRHLSVEKRNSASNPYDRAELLVNGQTVWINPFPTDVIDTDWTLVDYDISGIADNNVSVQTRFEMESDGGLEFGGWTIDDFEIYSVTPVNNVDTVAFTGDTQVSVGGTGSYNIDSEHPNSPFWIYGSNNIFGQTINGQAFDVGLPMKLLRNAQTDANGDATWTSMNAPPNLAGRTIYLEVRVDSFVDFKTYDSNVIAVTIN